MLSSKQPWVLLLFFLVIFSRFFKLNWGDNFFFNPDENNMARSVLQMNNSNLDPKFYAYGQLPLYLTFFSTPRHDFVTIIMTLRFWSALFSCLSLIIFYSIGVKIFKQKKLSLIFVLLLVFTPGLIQIAHFGTTESILLLVFATNILLSFKIFDTQKTKYLILASIISGVGLATKISALIFIAPILLSVLFLFFKKFKFKKFFLSSILFILITLLIGIILSPYNLIKFSDFISAMKYEIGVATGQIPVFYTRQFIGSLPYIFQFQKIFPYVNGLPIFIFGFIGFCLILKQYIINLPRNCCGHESNTYLLLTLFSALIYFVYQGQLFAKWTRFMSPIFFICPLLTIFLIQRIKSKFLFYLIIFISVVPGIYFLKIYFTPDIRVQATSWINDSINPQSQILSETGNVVDLPLWGEINTTNFDFYELENNFENQKKLEQYIDQSNYIFIPSRRVFKNQNNSNFPQSQKYYQDLFSGGLNFKLIKVFSNNNSFLLNPENAEETWSVFDNPTIRIFKKND